MNSAAQRLNQRRNISEVIGGSFDFYMRAPGPLFIAASPSILVAIIVYILGNLTESDVVNALLPLLALPLQFIVYILAGAAIVAALIKLDAGEKPSGGEALSAASERMDDLLSAVFRSTLIIFGLAITVIGIPWAIIRGVRWAFISQAIMIDNQTSATALDYSASLVIGNGWRTFWRLLAVNVVFGVIGGVLGEVMIQALSGFVGALAAGIVDAAVLPLTVIASTLIFFDLKLLKGETAPSTRAPVFGTNDEGPAPPVGDADRTPPTAP